MVASPEEAREVAKRQKRLGNIALTSIGVAVSLFVIATFVLVTTIQQNTKDRLQDDQIESRTPCEKQPPFETGCRQTFLTLVEKDLLPIRYICYTFAKAGVPAPACIERRQNRQTQTIRSQLRADTDAGSPVGPGTGSDVGPGASDDPRSPAPGGPPSPPPRDPPKEPKDPPPAPPPSPPQPPDGPGLGLCVENPALPVCVRTEGVQLP